MEWQQIIGSCPLAWREFVVGKPNLTFNNNGELVWVCSDGVHATCIHVKFRARDLYDFFDSLGIVLRIDIGINLGKWRWRFHIGYGATATLSLLYFTSRTEAESAAFTKAFEIREQQLKEQQ